MKPKSTNAATTASQRKESEEAFLTLLQRVQRHYAPPVTPSNATTIQGSSGGSGPSNIRPAAVSQRPPDAAATALGTQLALKLQAVAIRSQTPTDTDDDNDNDHMRSSPSGRLPKVPKGLQEKVLQCLVQSTMNPAVIVQFLTTLVMGHHKSATRSIVSTPLVQMEDWLPTWILHAEQIALENNNSTHNNFNAEPSFHALTTMIRAYGQYSIWWRIQHLKQTALATAPTTTTTRTRKSTRHHNSLSSFSSAPEDPLQIATTLTRFSSFTARRILIREWIPLVMRGVTKKSLVDRQKAAVVQGLISPLVAASVLTLGTSLAESALLLESIWRECWSELTTWSEDEEDAEDDLDLLEWLTQALTIYLWGLPCYQQASTTGKHNRNALSSMEQLTAGKELGTQWLLQLLELGAFCVSTPSLSKRQRVADWWTDIMASTLPRLFALLPSYPISLEAILWQLLHILQKLVHPEDDTSPTALRLDTVGTLRLAAVVLSNPLPEDVQVLLQILQLLMASSIRSNRSSTNNNNGGGGGGVDLTTLAIVRGLASMLVRQQGCQTVSQELIRTVTQLQQIPYKKRSTTSNTLKKIKASRACFGKMENVIQFLDDSLVDVHNFVTFLAKQNSLVIDPTITSSTLARTMTPMTAMQQTGSLLFGISLLMDQPQHQAAAYDFLTHLLAIYPHLGVSLLPVLVDCLNAACVKGEGPTVQRQLHFLCTALVQDTHCAREIWNLVGVELLKETTPTVIRSTVIRLFPKLCMANKRLYKRVMEALGRVLASTEGALKVGESSLELRLAVVVTIADLAKEDRIRDVTDVIGWIQGFITDSGWIRSVSTLDQQIAPGNAALVHYAILSLHYLLIAQELDFNLVIVVLKKRLCNIHDLQEVTKLPPLVLETLVQLLGDGECDDEEDDEAGLQSVGVSAQVSKSVETLVDLARTPKLHPKNAHHDTMLRGTLLRCRRNIHSSLAGYSVDALGLDDVGIKAVTAAVAEEEPPSLLPSGERYVALRQIVEDGIQILESGSYEMSRLEGSITSEGTKYTPNEMAESNISSSLVSLISTMLKFEESVLGASLWQKRGNQKGPANSKKFVQGKVAADASQVGALPSSAEVQKIYNGHRCSATAVAAMLCFEGKPLSLFSDLAGDVGHETSNPLMRAFTVQAWLNAARSTLMELVVSFSSSEGLENILLEIREWRYRFDTPDNMYLALASLALMIPDILGPYGDHTSYVNEICEEVWKGYTDHDFENPDIAKLCIGFVGVCDVRSRSIGRLREIVDALEKSVTGYGGKASSEAYYGMAIIAQSCPELFEEKGTAGEPPGDFGFIRKIVGLLLNELALCISGNHNALASLISSIKNGEISPEIIDTITAMGKKPMKMVKSKKEAAKSIFIGLALCLPALSAINDELLLGVYCLLEALPWGYGKGMALSSVLHACKRCGLFKTREIEKIYSKYAKIFEEGMDQGTAGIDDIFYAVTATMTKTIPYSIRRFLVGNRTLFDEDGRAVSLLAAVVSVSSLPCLGCGALSFTDTAQLSSRAASDDISGVKTLIAEAVSSRDWTAYPQIAVLLMGFLASMNNFADVSNASTQTNSSTKELAQMVDSKLPTAHQGTTLEAVMAALSNRFNEPNNETDDSSTNLLVNLLSCLEVLSLPGHFASFLEHLFRGNDETKTACTKLLISQIRGRPRAVFDGREYIDLALKMTKMPVSAIKSLLGRGQAPILFIEALVDLVPKFSTISAGEVVENFWRLCFNQVGSLPGMSVAFLSAMRSLVKTGGDKNTFLMSPNTLTYLRNFLVTRVFAGIRDAPWTSTSISSTTVEERSIVETYADCLLELPVTSLVDADFFTLKELDGFVGEALRYRCVMVLVRKGYFTTPSRASSEISSAIAWFSRQLTSSEEEIFSSTLLQVACSIAEATWGENSDQRRELLLTLLDNLLLTGPSASYVGLQMLGVLVCQWVNGSGSDGDLSLMCIMSSQMERWKELSPTTLQQTFRIIVHDLPFNLAAYARGEKLSGVVFNRLWRVYNKWFEQGAEQETIDCVRQALNCCRSADSGTEDFAKLATSMLT